MSLILLVFLYCNGIVQNDTNLPLPGVKVIEHGTVNKVVTNLKSEYSIQVSNLED